jgi:hypothetical protein
MRSSPDADRADCTPWASGTNRPFSDLFHSRSGRLAETRTNTTWIPRAAPTQTRRRSRSLTSPSRAGRLPYGKPGLDASTAAGVPLERDETSAHKLESTAVKSVSACELTSLGADWLCLQRVYDCMLLQPLSILCVAIGFVAL